MTDSKQVSGNLTQIIKMPINDNNEASTSSEKKDVSIITLPAEIFEHILRYLTFDNIAKLRLVSRYFNDMCSTLLNSEFSRLRVVIQQRFLALKAQMPRRESSRRKHPLARESDIVETLYMRLTLLNMTFGKHIERKYCCFFAGEILDEIYKIMHYVDSTPSLNRAYKVTDELFDLSTMAMEYFKEHIEPSLPEVTYFTTDVFDYPSISSVKASMKAKQSILDETTAAAAASSGASHSSHDSLLTLSKRMAYILKRVNKNSKELENMKRYVRTTNQKVNSLEEVINQMKWRQKSCDTANLPLKMNESHKINEIMVQLNMCKQEIEHLTSRLSACSDKESQLDWELLEKNANNGSNFNYSENQSISTVNASYPTNPKMASVEVIETDKFGVISSPLFASIISETESKKIVKATKRKYSSCTVTSISESPERKRNHMNEELNDSGIQEEQISTNS